MPTLFASIDSVFEGSDLLKQVSELVGSIDSIYQIVTQLIDHPPDDLSNLQSLLNEISLPDLNIGGDFASGLSGLKDALPGDLSSLTGSLVSGLEDLQMTVVGEISGLVGDSFKAIQAIYKLTQMDFKCENNDSETPGSGNPGSENPGSEFLIGSSMGSEIGFGNGNVNSNEEETDSTNELPMTDELNKVKNVLDLLPSAPDTKAVVTFLYNSVNWGEYLPFRLPIIDDLRSPLETLLKWDDMDSTAILAQLMDTLEDIEAFISGSIDRAMTLVTGELPGIRSRIPTTDLGQIADDLAARLSEAAAAIDSGDISGTGPAVSSIINLLDQYSTLRTTFRVEVSEKLPELNGRLDELANDLDESMGYLLSVLQPGDALAAFDSLLPGGQMPGVSSGLEEVEKMLGTFVGWFRSLAEKIDLEAIKEPLETVAEGAQTAVDALDNGMVQLTLAVQAVFGQVESLLDAVDVEAVMSRVENTIGDFQSQLGQFTSLLENVRDGITQAVTTVKNGVDAIDLEKIVNTLKSLFQGLTGVLEEPAVVSTVNAISTTLETITGAVEALSFAPVTDQVVGLIEGITEILRTVSSLPLSSDMEQSLQAAMASLPGDIKPTTDTIVFAFDDLVKSGPVQSLEDFNRQCRKFFDRVREFEPAALLGDSLTKPYQQLLAKIEPFKPSKLLEPLQEVLNQLKERLKDNVNPAQFIQPLEPIFDEIKDAFENLNPEKLIEPLEEVVTEVINDLLDALPVDEFFEQVNNVMDVIKKVVSFGDSIKTMIQKAHEIVKGFTDAKGQISSWADSILAKVDLSGSSTQLQPLLASINTALDNTKSAALSNRFNQVMNPLLNDLDILAPQARLTALVQAYRGISRQALAALPGSPEKTALITVLDQIDPLDTQFNEPYQCLATWQETLVQVKTKFQTVLVDWDERYHGNDSILAGFYSTGIDTAQLRQMMHDTIETQVIKPLSPLFSVADLLHRTIGSFLSQFKELVTILQEKFASLLLGPDSLSGIIDALKELIQKLRDFNLDFLTESLESLFDKIGGKLDAVSPKRLREKLEELFNHMLDLISLDLLISPDDVAQLDSDFEEVLNKFKAMDPEKIITEVFQKEFDEKIVPLLDVFDLSKFFDVLLERLQVLNEELQTEMVRVTGAYRDMRQSVE